MSNASEHEEEEDDMPGWLQLVLFPLLLVAYIRQLFAEQAEQLRHTRRTRPPLARWDDHLEGLRQSEQLIAAITAEGARRILNGEDLDLDHLSIYAPDDNQPWIVPSSYQQVYLRILAQTRFHADPEFFIYRHAFRIARRMAVGAVGAMRVVAIARHSAPPGRATATTLSVTRTRAGMRVRAPPWRNAIPYSPLPTPSKRQLPRPRALEAGSLS